MTYLNENDEINLVKILAVIKKNWILIAAIVLILPALKVLTTKKPVRMYKSETLVRIGRAGNRPLESPGEIASILKSPGALKPMIVDIRGRSVTDTEVNMVKNSVNLISDGRLTKISVESDSADFSRRLSAIMADKIIKRHVLFYQNAEETLNFLKNKVQLMRYPGAPYDLNELSNEPTVMEIATYTMVMPESSGGMFAILSILTIFGLMLGVIVAFIKDFVAGYLLKQNK